MPLAKKIKRRYSYSDYCTWDDSARVELIDGEVYDMTPAPDRRHQAISMTLSMIIGNFLRGKKCKVYAAPFDVRLPDGSESDDNIFTVVQPDISVICDQKKLDRFFRKVNDFAAQKLGYFSHTNSKQISYFRKHSK